MKNKRIIIILILLVLLFLVGFFCDGCSTVRDNVPATQFSAFLNGHPATFTGPKDMKAASITFTAETNGAVKLEIVGLEAHTNPDVISMTGDAYAKMQKANGDALEQSFNAGAAIIGNAAAAAAKTGVK